jgi:ribosomal protein L37E
MFCRHCGERRANRPRGLCAKCYYRAGVRDRYPASARGPQREPTAAEVEATVAEQMKHLPKWWASEQGKR